MWPSFPPSLPRPHNPPPTLLLKVLQKVWFKIKYFLLQRHFVAAGLICEVLARCGTKKKKVLFLLLSDRDRDRKRRKKRPSFGFLAAVTRPKQNRWYQQSFKSLLLLISEGREHTFGGIVSFMVSLKNPQLNVKTESTCVVHPAVSSFILIIHFTPSLFFLFPTSLRPSQKKEKKKEKKNIMWTFCLIKGLDTLPWSRRKAPFISSYWIFVCVVSLLFNFTPQFAFITAQPREPVDIQKQCHAEFKYLQPGHWLESICVHYHLNVLDSSSITEGMAAVQTWLIWEVNISRLFFFFF